MEGEGGITKRTETAGKTEAFLNGLKWCLFNRLKTHPVFRGLQLAKRLFFLIPWATPGTTASVEISMEPIVS